MRLWKSDKLACFYFRFQGQARYEWVNSDRNEDNDPGPSKRMVDCRDAVVSDYNLRALIYDRNS